MIAGYTRHQIYSTDAYIYSVSSSFEWLYRVGFHRELDMNVTDGETAFRRVSETDSRLHQLRQIRPTPIKGYPEVYRGKKYQLYVLKNVSPRVYVLAPEKFLKSPLDDVFALIYFIYEPKER